MEQYIIDYLTKNNHPYIEIENSESLNIIYNLYRYTQIQENIDYDDAIIYLYYGIYFKINNYYSKAKKYYTIATDKDSIHGMFYLGHYYYKIEKNYNEAIKYFLKVSDKGYSSVMINLGSCYYREKNYDEAIKYYLIAIDCDNIDTMAMINLGNCYREITNYDKAKIYYLMAIDKDNCSAMNNLGNYYYEIEKNYGEAKKYFLMAIDNLNSDSMNTLGNYYYEIEKNYGEAKKYYLMAISHDNYISMTNLGNYYWEVKNNYYKAKKYYLMAIDHNCNIAINSLGNYYYKIEKNYDEAIKYYLMAINNNNYDAVMDLLKCYEDNLNQQTINDAINISHKLNKFDHKYKFIKKLFNNTYNITNYYMLTEYIFSTNVQIQIAKYKQVMCNHKILFDNYNNILLLLHRMVHSNIPKYIKIHIIYYVTI